MSSIPSSLLDMPGSNARSRNDRNSTQLQQEKQQQQIHALVPSSMICITGVMFIEGTLKVPRRTAEGSMLTCSLHYRIFRARQLKMQPPPLVVVHGGPSIPSNYLLSLVNVITDRAVIFYDQVGCGKSSRPAERECYSMDYSVSDLNALIQHLKLLKYHLFGHSFGGLVTFEYIKSLIRDEQTISSCCSMILSSTPTSTRLAQDESKYCMDQLRDTYPDYTPSMLQELYHQQNECRIVPPPLALTDAYAQAGNVWRGMDAIPDYEAQATITTSKLPPTLILRGQYDFISERCIEEWSTIIPSSHQVTLAGCSHHGLLENEAMYGAAIGGFIEDCD